MLNDSGGIGLFGFSDHVITWLAQHDLTVLYGQPTTTDLGEEKEG